MGRVAFDPRPGFEHVVYACKTGHHQALGAWRSLDNANCTYLSGQPHRPVYRSLDGGRSWHSLHAPEYRALPDYLDITAFAVCSDGALRLDGYHGLYTLPGPQ